MSSGLDDKDLLKTISFWDFSSVKIDMHGQNKYLFISKIMASFLTAMTSVILLYI